jgi:hypothetical protein
MLHREHPENVFRVAKLRGLELEQAPRSFGPSAHHVRHPAQQLEILKRPAGIRLGEPDRTGHVNRPDVTVSQHEFVRVGNQHLVQRWNDHISLSLRAKLPGFVPVLPDGLQPTFLEHRSSSTIEAPPTGHERLSLHYDRSRNTL